MAKVNKLALLRLALRKTIGELNTRELLCVLADMYTGDNEHPRWNGNGGGPSGLEQGIYDHMTTFRRVSDLWAKILKIHNGNKDASKQETYNVRDVVVSTLNDRGVDLDEIQDHEDE
jgi:hypothetical protein